MAADADAAIRDVEGKGWQDEQSRIDDVSAGDARRALGGDRDGVRNGGRPMAGELTPIDLGTTVPGRRLVNAIEHLSNRGVDNDTLQAISALIAAIEIIGGGR